MLLGLGLVTASRATTLGQFQVLFGVLVGAAAGSFFAPLVATTTRWFTRNRSLAVALVSAGLSLGPTTVGPRARWLITAYDWRTAMLVIGDLAWLLIIPAALLVREPPSAAALVTLSGSTQCAVPGACGTVSGTVDLAAIATGADQALGATGGA